MQPRLKQYLDIDWLRSNKSYGVSVADIYYSPELVKFIKTLGRYHYAPSFDAMHFAFENEEDAIMLKLKFICE